MTGSVLVTGGTGFIGSHVVVTLINSGFDVVILDNLSNSESAVIDGIEKITGIRPSLFVGDVGREEDLDLVFSSRPRFDAVLHFAGLKSVDESIVEPTRYYATNFIGTVNLCQFMLERDISQFIFSSSATVYGESANCPCKEDDPIALPSNPYGRSKFFVECFLQDVAAANPRLKIGVLRYFNPVGAHSSGLIGEKPLKRATNLVPMLLKVAKGERDVLEIFGNDYPSRDGSAVRDFIHVMDLAEGHLHALRALQGRTGIGIWNLGTGEGQTVMEIVSAFESASGIKIPLQVSPRRVGDAGLSWASTIKARHELNWTAKKSLVEMMQDVWRWSSSSSF